MKFRVEVVSNGYLISSLENSFKAVAVEGKEAAEVIIKQFFALLNSCEEGDSVVSSMVVEKSQE